MSFFSNFPFSPIFANQNTPVKSKKIKTIELTPTSYSSRAAALWSESPPSLHTTSHAALSSPRPIPSRSPRAAPPHLLFSCCPHRRVLPCRRLSPHAALSLLPMLHPAATPHLRCPVADPPLVLPPLIVWSTNLNIFTRGHFVSKDGRKGRIGRKCHLGKAP